MDASRLIRQGLRMAIALSSAVLAFMTAHRAVQIFRAGAGFTPDNVRSALTGLAPLAGLWLVLVLAGLIWETLAPAKPSPKMSAELQAALLNFHREPTAETALIGKKRRRAWLACGLVCLISTIPCGIFMTNVENFGSWDVEKVLADMLRAVGPWLLVMLAANCAAAVYDRICAKKLIALLKEQPKRKIRPIPRKESRLLTVRLIVCTAAVVFIALGIANGGMRDVLVKAINICTECIGLG